MSRATGALAELTSRRIDYEVSAMLWVQGESDGKLNKGAQYEANLRVFIADMRTQFKKPDLPFYMARIRLYYAPKGLVRAAQVKIAGDTANVEWFDTDMLGNPLISGGHYNSNGQIQIGTLFANTYLASGQAIALLPSLPVLQNGIERNIWICDVVGYQIPAPLAPLAPLVLGAKHVSIRPRL